MKRASGINRVTLSCRSDTPGRMRAIALLLVCCLLLASGCGRGLRVDYGESTGVFTRQSINGFSTLRQSFVNAGFDDRDLHRLTDRARRVSAIVWTPTHPSGIESKTTRWMNGWLRSGNKTLIYVIPDSGSLAAFYRDARPLASPEQRLEYRRLYGQSLTEEHRWQLARKPFPSNGWFFARPQVQTTRVQIADAAARQTGWESDTDQIAPRRFEWEIEAYDSSDKTQNGMEVNQAVGPGAPSWSFNKSTSPSGAEVDFQPVLQSEDGATLVARVTSDSWRDSQILVVAGGSLLTNYGLTVEANERLAGQLIDRSLQTLIDGGAIDPEMRLASDGSAPQVGFANANGVMSISRRIGDVPRAAGAELLAVYPMSLVTIHLGILGFVICLMLMPVFGRPRHVNRGVLTHFGDHLDAVATLMRRRGGEAYARRRISDYMKRASDDPSGKWILEDPKPSPTGLASKQPPVAATALPRDTQTQPTQTQSRPASPERSNAPSEPGPGSNESSKQTD